MDNKELIFDDTIEELIESMDLTQEPPSQEPERQYWYMKKARELVKARSQELGRPLTACTVTFGCQVNLKSEKKQHSIAFI